MRVEVERDGARTRLGRTNTEHAPSFGANARRAAFVRRANARAERSCPHAAPRTAAFEAEEGAARLVAGSDLSPLGVAPVLEAYAPAAGAASLVLTLLDERYSVERGVVGEVVGEARVDLPAPSAGPPAPAWVPVGGSGAEVFVAVHVAALEGAAAAALPDGGDEDLPARVARRRRAAPRPRRPGTTPGCAATARRSRRRARGSAGSPPRPRPRRGPGRAASSRRRARATLRGRSRHERARVPGVGARRRGRRGAPRHVHGRRARRRRHARLGRGRPPAPAAGTWRRRDARRRLRDAARARPRAGACRSSPRRCAPRSPRFSPAAGPAKEVCESWREKGTDVVFLSLISTAGRELAMLEDVAGIVDALQDVNVDVCGGFGYDPSTRTLGLGMAGVGRARALSRVGRARGAGPRRAPVARALAADGQGRRELVPGDGEDRGPRRAPTARRQQRRGGAGRAISAVGRRRAAAPEHAQPRGGERLATRAEKLGDGGASRHYAAAVERETAALASGAFEKHWTIIVEAERLARRLDLPLAVFCKSGKDQRTN